MTNINPGGHAGGSDVKYNIENRLNQVTNTNTNTDTNTKNKHNWFYQVTQISARHDICNYQLI